jgi:hypothetical protein
MEKRAHEIDRNVPSAAHNQVGVNRPHFYRIGNARRTIFLTLRKWFFARMVPEGSIFKTRPAILDE